ncbi:ferritin-like domain-containing protein [Tumebacillus permanentifrigoris]|uniref:Rubrerythrin n=1 Tax=Tumebacillus permanentifrigoris TaxID=378543 RepID=A0A316DE25_9BACL|nr:ferritin-like domain-containing protein [Tumebacillus permanentifrigoris]PWK13917.1 rubrerythrin [Tumebacillus permanentifrigoris]
MNDQSNLGNYGLWYYPVALPMETIVRGQVSQNLLENVAKATNAEYNAIRAYEALVQLAPNKEFAGIITNIRNDEIAHFRNFSQIFSVLTKGRQPQLTSNPLPTNFRVGVEESIRDELEDSKFYQETTKFTTDQRILTTLRDASADEARHATWFSYIWSRTP